MQDKDIKKEPIKTGFGRGLLQAGKADPNIVVNNTITKETVMIKSRFFVLICKHKANAITPK